jgi:hypothetical protein
MKRKILAICALFAGFAAMGQAQTSGQFSISCGQTTVEQQITATSTISTFPCTTNATINGVAFTGLTFSATGQFDATVANVWGVFVGTLSNGNAVYFEYHTSYTRRNGVDSIPVLTYKIVGGTGIATGISGSGTCKVTGTSTAGGAEDSCVGNYAIR